MASQKWYMKFFTPQISFSTLTFPNPAFLSSNGNQITHTVCYIPGGLTAITLHLTESAQALLSLNLVPGKKLCPTCRKKVVDSIKKKEETSSEEEVESEDGEMSMVEMEYERQQACNQLSDCFNTIGVSPIKTHSRPKRSQVKQGQKKIKAVMTSISDKVAKSLNVPIESVIPPSKAEKLNKELEQKAKDFDELMQALAEKVKSLKDRRLKMQILTLVPSSWSMKKTEEFFKVSNYMVRAARKLVQEKGILALPDKKVDGEEAVGDEEMDEQEIFAIPNETVNETGILAISDEEE